MARQCLFCPNPADSAEHLWSDWILKDLKPVQPIHIKFGKTFAKWVDDPEMRAHCVCQKCNNGWMSEIESENKPHMLAMMNDKAIVLEPTQQKLLARWAILKAMVLDGWSPKRRSKLFYSDWERTSMKPSLRALPVGTFTWIGRLPVKEPLHAGLTDTFGGIDKVNEAFQGCITTIVVGHLVIQVATIHTLPMFATLRLCPRIQPGAWNTTLLEIWPVFGEKSWPPPSSFQMKGTTHHIAGLINRWKIGEDITK